MVQHRRCEEVLKIAGDNLISLLLYLPVTLLVSDLFNIIGSSLLGGVVMEVMGVAITFY